jgi:succinate dehydrogenase/fumarate reductase flavoprotein subunit
MVKSGKDTEFNRRNPVDVFAGTLYAVPFRAKVQGTFGGVKTNENCEALRADGSVFPGLYAVGEAASCGLRGVNPQTANVVFGSIAGRKACAYAKTI